MAELFAPLRNGGYALFGDAAYIYDQGVEHVSGEKGRRGHVLSAEGPWFKACAHYVGTVERRLWLKKVDLPGFKVPCRGQRIQGQRPGV